MPPNAALIATDPRDANIARDALGSYGFEVKEFSTVADCKRAVCNDGTSDVTFAVFAGIQPSAIESRQLAVLRQECPGLPIIVASGELDLAGAVELMKQGASDVVTLPCPQEEIWAKIRGVMDSVKKHSESNRERLGLQERMVTLTKAEIDVLEMLLDGQANKQISQNLGIGLRTVELRRSKIMKKMQARSIAELIKMVCIARGISTLGECN